MRNAIIAALFAASTLVGAAEASTVTHDGAARRTVTVTVADLDLATAGGYHAAERRLIVASWTVCAEVHRADAVRDCRDGALSAAERQLAVLVHEERTAKSIMTAR